MTRWVGLLVVGVACGAAEAEAPAPQSPPREDLEAALTKDGEDTCRRACDRVAACASPEGESLCRQDCGSLLEDGHAPPGLRYASCLNAMSCEEITRAVRLAVGPIGQCFVAAERMGR